MKFNPTYFFILFLSSIFGQQNVLITDNALITAPAPSSVLEINSSNKGLLIPRVALQSTTDGATILLPERSLLVYNTATAGTAPTNVISGYYYNEGTTLAPQWVRLFASNSAGGEWKLLGNAGTNATNNFIGTTDAVDFVVRTNNLERMRVLSSGNVGIGEVNPSDRLQVSNGNLRVGELSTTAGPAGYGRLLYFSGGSSFLGNSDNTDPIFFGRFNVANDESELRLNLGDNNGYGGTAIDRLIIGNNEGGGWFPKFILRSDGKLTISRDGVGECCGNDATLAIGENTTGTSRRPSISFHASGESEGTIYLTQEATGIGNNIFTNRRMKFFDNQSQGLGLELSGNLWFGNGNSRTQTKDNAGLQGNAGSQSGFFESASPTNYPPSRGQSIGPWYHLLDVRHSNASNNYALQFSGSFFDQDVFVRKTDNNPAQPWSRVVTSRNVVYSQNRNTYFQDNQNLGYRVTGEITPALEVRSGDVITIFHTSKFRWTGGNGGDHPFYGVRITGCASTSVRDIERIGTADDLPRGQWQTIAGNYVWVCTCNGTVQFQLEVDNNSDADDSSEYRDIVLIVTRY